MTASQAISRLRQVIRRQHEALATEQTYVLWLRRYIAALQKMSTVSTEQTVKPL